MVGSFIVLVIGFLLHLILVSLMPMFDFLASWTPWTLGAVIALAVIFVIFTIVKLIRK